MARYGIGFALIIGAACTVEGNVALAAALMLAAAVVILHGKATSTD